VAAHADVITIDGDDSDWLAADIDSMNDDPQDIFESGTPYLEYDLDFTYAEWDEVNEISNFMGITYAPLSHEDIDDRVEILLNIDDDNTTGSLETHSVAGLEYRAVWNLDGVEGTVYGATWEQWNDSGNFWETVSVPGGSLKFAWSNDTSDADPANHYGIIEGSIDPTLFEWPDKFQWGMYLDNGTNPDDDSSPAGFDQRGYTPEPTTMVLLPLGLAGLAALRRRREDD
jgi:hypothetical protein